MKIRHSIVVALIVAAGGVLLAGCEETDLAYKTTPARRAYVSQTHNDLISLPEPEEKIVVAAYKFRDQTGQYKTSGAATTFSTAVTQGATAILNKALEDSGWFTPIERESLANLLNERKIIRASRLEYQSSTGEQLPDLPPMLYAAVLLEGGVVGYDTDYVTGGLGVRYFGVGGSGKIRKDRVTIYLRLVSIRNGEILKSVSTTKSILSRQVDFNVYRFVSVKELLEVETGLSTNEPATMCVTGAIEKAVSDLIIEGILDGLWALKNPGDINHPTVQNYLVEKRASGAEIIFAKDSSWAIIEQPDHGEPNKPQPAIISEPQRETPVKSELVPEASSEPEESDGERQSEPGVTPLTPAGSAERPEGETGNEDRTEPLSIQAPAGVDEPNSGIIEEAAPEAPDKR